MLSYLDRYGDGLVGRAVAVVDRTNNVLEQFFARTKQDLQRRLGRAHLGRDLEDQPAQAALAQNLRHPDSVQILCGVLDELPQAFASLDRQEPVGPPRLQSTNRDSEPRRRNRVWAKEAQLGPRLPPAIHSQTRPELQISNSILTR